MFLHVETNFRSPTEYSKGQRYFSYFCLTRCLLWFTDKLEIRNAVWEMLFCILIPCKNKMVCHPILTVMHWALFNRNTYCSLLHSKHNYCKEVLIGTNTYLTQILTQRISKQDTNINNLKYGNKWLRMMCQVLMDSAAQFFQSRIWNGINFMKFWSDFALNSLVWIHKNW